MRVIGGEFRSRKLKSMPGMDVRPTPDRLREALFNVLSPRIAGAVFVDAYAGTGAVGIEALSRGAGKAIFIEDKRGPAELIAENLRTLQAESRAEIVRAKASLVIARYSAGIVFLDPPYELEREYQACLDNLGHTLEPPPLVIAQHDSKLILAESYGALRRFRLLKQGDNSLSFYAPGADAE
ncbi:MAG TPA: 16S rRNA (guanine(966)-N(2))-methyltransferase RsmD [Solibacterales bacterium]|nr:16S rRNA (guanine(966)-N(2))-methyltransferase RsmD [Bryobacterales bacterium]